MNSRFLAAAASLASVTAIMATVVAAQNCTDTSAYATPSW